MTDLQNAHVIVVEDNPNNTIAIFRLLRHIGIQHCNCYLSGRSVVTFVKSVSNAECPPDLILLDIGLPGEDGYAVLRSLRSDLVLKDTRVVAITARASYEEMLRTQEAGFDGFIGKPLSLEKFPEQIRRILAGEEVWEVEV